MIREAIRSVVEKKNLPFEMARLVMEEIMQGQATNAQIAAFLTAMRMKGETIDEITACATVMRDHCTKLRHKGDVLEIVGTGGDEAYTFNISTVAAFVAAAAGVPVAKHGNRSVSSKCGAADLLEALGVRLDLTAEQSGRVLEQTGMCFMFAPIYHASMKYAAPIRKEMGTRTIFNILGPLANPASASIQLLGVYNENLVKPLAQVLSNLGVKRAMVVHGNDGLDEISLSTTTTVCEVNCGELSSYILDPCEFGFELCQPDDLVGGDAAENAKIALSILRGEKGSKRDVVLLNATVCLYMAGKTEKISDGIALAAEIIESGKAYEQMKRFVRATNEVSQ
ncbi:MAG: anthranilate phosphoribosyltransferase [Methanocorpusculum sp.]|nr:anthranilate phosphoribosyltransferase [Methanocorpusculum sp.]MDD2400931.1 anthranilate phosphoribosyltransferase [Clostridia bacterium]MDD4047567.1 anthranilate phosphoribosyltransferase [Clostridia bacterium]